MRHLRAIGEDEMVAVFLRAEIASPRYGSAIRAILDRDGHDRRLVDEPDPTDPAANAVRRRLLGEYRGYGRNADVFTGFPADVRWYRALATREDLARVRYIDYDYWIELSGGSRLVVDAVVRITRGIEVFGVSNAGIWYLADLIAAGAVPPEPILVGAEEGAPLVILEGHARLTAYLLRPEHLPPLLEILVGYSPVMDK
jgi:hypothetical protein